MTDLGEYACTGCGGPLRYGIRGLTCVMGIVPAGAQDCDGRKRIIPGKPRPKVVELYQCSGCKTKVKVKPDDELPDHECACGGLLVFIKAQSR